MGQHKHNPTAIKAKNGELPPKKPVASKREVQQALKAEIERRLGITQIREAMIRRYF